MGDTENPSTYSLPILVADDGSTVLIVIPLYDWARIDPSLYLPGDFSVICMVDAPAWIALNFRTIGVPYPQVSPSAILSIDTTPFELL